MSRTVLAIDASISWVAAPRAWSWTSAGQPRLPSSLAAEQL